VDRHEPDGSLTIPVTDTVSRPSRSDRLPQAGRGAIRTSDLGIIVWDTYRADQRTLKIQRASDIQL